MRSLTTAPHRLDSLGLLMLSGALMLTSGCAAGLQVHHAADPGLEPSRYASYEVVANSVGHGDADEAIEAAVHEHMQKRGYTRVTAAQPDLLVSVKVLTAGLAEGEGGGSQAQLATGGGAMGGAESLTDEMMADEQSLEKLVMVQLMDARDMSVVWVGWARGTVSSKKLSLAATAAVSRILVRMPSRRPATSAG